MVMPHVLACRSTRMAVSQREGSGCADACGRGVRRSLCAHARPRVIRFDPNGLAIAMAAHMKYRTWSVILSMLLLLIGCHHHRRHAEAPVQKAGERVAM